MKIGIDQET